MGQLGLHPATSATLWWQSQLKWENVSGSLIKTKCNTTRSVPINSEHCSNRLKCIKHSARTDHNALLGHFQAKPANGHV